MFLNENELIFSSKTIYFLQEHVVHFMVKLLSPPIPPNFTGTRSHLIDYLPMLSAILFGAASIDTVHILSLHGVVSELLFRNYFICWFLGVLSQNNTFKKKKTNLISF